MHDHTRKIFTVIVIALCVLFLLPYLGLWPSAQRKKVVETTPVETVKSPGAEMRETPVLTPKNPATSNASSLKDIEELLK